jgi:hypothetical protein
VITGTGAHRCRWSSGCKLELKVLKVSQEQVPKVLLELKVPQVHKVHKVQLVLVLLQVLILKFSSTTSGSFAGSSNLTFDGTDLTCGGAVVSNSDEKLKTNITTISNPLQKVLSLRGVEFDFIANGKHSIGFIAQEVEQIMPDLVFGDDPKSVAYQNFVALLVEAIKEQNDLINNLKERIVNLEDNR